MVSLNVFLFTTSLRNCGPNRQLLNLIKHLLAAKVSVTVLTLKKPFTGDLYNEFVALGVQPKLLIRSRKDWLRVSEEVRELSQSSSLSVLHSHGLLPDLVSSFCSTRAQRVITVRNSPFEDYKNKFGDYLGAVMALVHLHAFRSGAHLVACSSYINQVLLEHKLDSLVIRNGVDASRVNEPDVREHNSLQAKGQVRFVTASSLLPRKNIIKMLMCFGSDPLRSSGNLLVLGGGPLMEEAVKMRLENVALQGQVNDPLEHYETGHIFLSLSSSEGMPNSVLEALIKGLPCILSDIPPHREIFDLMPNAVRLVNLNLGIVALAQEIKEHASDLLLIDGHNIREDAKSHFCSSITSQHYLASYLFLTSGTTDEAY